MDWQETFWAHGFGKVSDQYGVPWMINVVKQQQPLQSNPTGGQPPVLSSNSAQLFIIE